MTFTVNSLTRCSGQQHYDVALTFGGGQTATLRFHRDDFLTDPPENVEQAREMVLTRLRSAVKEANASTFAQAKTALESNTYRV